MNSRMSGGMIRFGLPGLVLGVTLSWMGGAQGPQAEAQTRSPGELAGGVTAIRAGAPGRSLGQTGPGRAQAGGDANGTMAFVVTPPGSPQQWLYLIDTRNQAFAIYRVDTSNTKGAVKLEAARQYQWDLKLDHYNNLAPEPAAIESQLRAPSQSTTR